MCPKLKARLDWFRPRFRNWLRQVLIALDQLLNAILGGYSKETISARAWRKALTGQWFWRGLRRLIDLVFFWDGQFDESGIKIKGHCRLSAENEKAGLHQPAELRSEL